MGFYLQLQGMDIALLVLPFALIFVYMAVNGVKGSKRKGKRPPEPSGAWPLIGHLHLLGSNSSQLLHQTLGAIADEHGPAFIIRLGFHEVLVISSWELAKECFTVNDKVLSTRPRNLAAKIMGYNHAMLGFAPHGPYWRDLRKFAAVELLSSHRLELLKHVRDAEVKFFVKQLQEKCAKSGGLATVEMKERFGDLAMSIIVRIMAGRRYFSADAGADEQESRRCQKALADFFYLAGLIVASDAIPFLGWLDVMRGYVGEMKRTAEELDSVFGNWVEEHRRKRLNGSIDEQDKDFIDVMMSSLDEGRISAPADADTVIKATCFSLILGGNDTTVVTLTWALSLLLNHRHALRKVQSELDIHVGKHRQVEESDIKNLTYLQAIVKEIFRLYPALPLSGPRQAMEDCNVAGFHIPAGTHLLVNLWKLHRDPRIWSNPSEFIPERFLNEHANLDVRGQDFEYIPFGSGRRKCPGISFGLQVLHLTLARLLHSFELGTVSDTSVDMSEGPGMTVRKAAPLEVTLTPRLDSKLFE